MRACTRSLSRFAGPHATLPIRYEEIDQWRAKSNFDVEEVREGLLVDRNSSARFAAELQVQVRALVQQLVDARLRLKSCAEQTHPTETAQSDPECVAATAVAFSRR